MKRLLVFAAIAAALTLVAPLSAADDKAKAKEKKKQAAAAPAADNDQFKKLDTNSDGKLSLEEFKAMFETRTTSKGKKGGGPDPFKLFSQLDANSDNSLTLTEFKNLKPSDLQPEPKKKK